MKAIRRQECRARLRHAQATGPAQVIDIAQYLLAQLAKQSSPACFGAHVAVTDAHRIRLVLDADEAQHPCLPLVPDDEPAMARPVVQRIAAALTAHRGAGEETAHLGEERGFVVIRAQLQELAILQLDHEVCSSLGTRVSTSRRAKPKDSERAMSCLSSDSATRLQDGCALRFSSAGTPASGHSASG